MQGPTSRLASFVLLLSFIEDKLTRTFDGFVHAPLVVLWIDIITFTIFTNIENLATRGPVSKYVYYQMRIYVEGLCFSSYTWFHPRHEYCLLTDMCQGFGVLVRIISQLEQD